MTDLDFMLGVDADGNVWKIHNQGGVSVPPVGVENQLITRPVVLFDRLQDDGTGGAGSAELSAGTGLVGEASPVPSPSCRRCGGTDDLRDRGMAPGMTYCRWCREFLMATGHAQRLQDELDSLQAGIDALQALS